MAEYNIGELRRIDALALAIKTLSPMVTNRSNEIIILAEEFERFIIGPSEVEFIPNTDEVNEYE